MLRLLLITFLLLQSSLVLAASEKLKNYIGKINGTITVLASGEVAAVELKNVGDKDLNTFLTGAVKKWQFNPMRINGQPIDVTTTFSFNAITAYDSKRIIKSIKYSHIIFDKSDLEKEKYAELKNVQKREEVFYPKDALRFGLTSLVTIAVKISSEGAVENAAVVNMALLGVEDNGGANLKAFADKTFARNALYAIRQWSWSKEELQYYQCQNGCVRLIRVDYIFEQEATWKAYSPIKIDIPEWVFSADAANQIFDTNSQLVRLKNNAGKLPTEIDG